MQNFDENRTVLLKPFQLTFRLKNGPFSVAFNRLSSSTTACHSLSVFLSGAIRSQAGVEVAVSLLAELVLLDWIPVISIGRFRTCQ